MRPALLATAVFLSWSPAFADVVVTDPITEANTLQSTIQNIKAAADRVTIINNQLTAILHLKNTVEAVAHGDVAALNNLAPELGALGITMPMGSDVSGLVSSITGLAAAGGGVVAATNTTGMLTQQLLHQDQYYTPSGQDRAARILNQMAQSAAAEKAVAQTSLDANTQRLQQLNTLRTGLGANKDVTAAAQATARLSGEQATAQAQTNQLLALMMLRDAQKDTLAAQQQQMARCSADQFVLAAKASIDAANAGAVNLIGPTVSSINCAPPVATATATQISATTDNPGTLVSGGPAPTAVSADSTALGTMLATSWGQTAADNATALGVNPTALAATCVLESNCTANPGGTGTISGAFQMSNGTYQQTVSEVSASNPALASQITTKNDPASQSIAASQYLLDGAQSLVAAGITQPTALDVRGYYQFGPANGAYLAGAPDNQLMVATVTGLSANALAANNITSNTTVGQWRATVTSKIGSAASQPVLLGSPT